MNRATIVITFLSILISLCPLGAGAQRTASDFFVSAPPEVVKYIDPITRLDMIDYYHSGSSTASSNAFYEPCRLTSESAESVIFQVADSVTCQLSMHTSQRGDTIISVIETLRVPMADSDIRFYTSEWKPAGKKVFSAPGIADWMPNKKDREEFASQIPFMTAEYIYDPATFTLVVRPTIDKYFYSTDRPAILSKIPEQIEYRWTGKRFEKISQQKH